jgi:hypothetical protein
VAQVEVPRDGEEPRGESRVVPEARNPLHQPEPRLLEKLLGQLATACQAEEERDETPVPRLVDPVERDRVTRPQAADQPLFGFGVHPED